MNIGVHFARTRWMQVPVVGWLALAAGLLILGPAGHLRADPSDPAVRSLIGTLVQKGILSEDEGAKFQSQMDAESTNSTVPPPDSKWKVSSGLKSVELFGDLRTRFEDRSASDPSGDSVELQRFRYSARLGLRGEALEDFYYGLRVETASSPRSSFVTMGTSASGFPYQGPYGKSSATISIGQLYVGWKPEPWLDVTVGKMPNPLYTTTMVWSRNINPEGLAERFNDSVGRVDFFANFGQFLYQDANPVSASPDLGLGANPAVGQSANNLFQVAWEGGLTYHITTNTSFKIAGAFYQYFGLAQGSGIAPYFGDNYVGEGAYTGPTSLYPTYGYSGYGSSSLSVAGDNSYGYPNNQTGLNDLAVVEIPFEFNFKISGLDARIFGDAAYNLEGSQRAGAAAAGYAAYLNYQNSNYKAFTAQTHEDKACQIGFAIGNQGSLGLANGGGAARKHAWEVRAFWQHVEQYSLDPNLLDLDVFAAAENLQGIYAEAAYGFSQNFVGAFHYGYATRINDNLGTGGTGTDIPQVNPVNNYQLFQVDLTFKF